MPAKTLAASLCLLIVPAAALAADQDMDQLRAEIAALKARAATLEQACPAAASVAPDAAAPAEPASVPVLATAAPPTPAPPLPAPAAAAPPPAPVAQAASLEPRPAPTTPPAAPAPAAVAVLPKRYDDTGCDRGIFNGPAPGKWRDAKSWDGVSKGMEMADVEARLGVEHYDAEKRDALQWQYGRCGGGWEGSVTFVDGRAVSVSPPDR